MERSLVAKSSQEISDNLKMLVLELAKNNWLLRIPELLPVRTKTRIYLQLQQMCRKLLTQDLDLGMIVRQPSVIFYRIQRP